MELKPCPRCGYERVELICNVERWYSVICPLCCNEGPMFFDHADDAARAWNALSRSADVTQCHMDSYYNPVDQQDITDLLAEVDRLRAREEWLVRELAMQGNARGYESFCPMPGDYNCAWRQGCDLCGAQIKARAECWRKAADMATRGNSGESGNFSGSEQGE